MSTNKTIYIIRHGQTDFNKNGIIQGSGIDSELNETGLWQAAQFYLHYQHVQFDQIFTSQLHRTKQSVAAFERNGIPTKALLALNEINWGIFEGKESTQERKQAYNQIVMDWRANKLDQPIEGGESPLDMFYRQQSGWEEITKHPGQNLLISMHGRALRCFLSLILNTPLKDMDDYGHTNLCLYKVEYRMDGTAFLLEANNTNHLSIGKPDGVKPS